jgi:hypothetical protein
MGLNRLPAISEELHLTRPLPKLGSDKTAAALNALFAEKRAVGLCISERIAKWVSALVTTGRSLEQGVRRAQFFEHRERIGRFFPV